MQAKKEKEAAAKGNSSSKVSVAMNSLSKMNQRIEDGSCRANHVTARVKFQTELLKEGIALSLCDGIGCAGRALQDLGMASSHCIGAEINAASKKVAQNLNPVSSRFKGIDHSHFSPVM